MYKANLHNIAIFVALLLSKPATFAESKSDPGSLLPQDVISLTLKELNAIASNPKDNFVYIPEEVSNILNDFPVDNSPDNLYDSKDEAIGNSGTSGDDNAIKIGFSHTACFIAGIAGVSIGGQPQPVYISTQGATTGQLGTVTSSRRFKDDIVDMGTSSSNLMKLRPVNFKYKKDIDELQNKQYGLIAEEVEQIYPELISYDKEGKPTSVAYHTIIPMLLNEIQKQRKELDMLLSAQQK